MKQHNVRAGAAAMLACMMLAAGCSPKGAGVEGLDKLGEVHALSREAGSGTRASFDELADIIAEDENLTVAKSTDDMHAEIGKDASAIGYLTDAAADEKIKVLKVDGKEITDRKYPLIRKVYLVSRSDANDLEKEFITYVQGKGQDIVAGSFEQLNSSVTFLSMKPEGRIVIGGSTTVSPVMKELAEAYMKENPNAQIEVVSTDSSDGITGTMNGTYDLGMSSRDPKSFEKELVNFNAIGQDRIAIAVSKDNPLEDITTSQLDKIYTGKVRNWADLNK